VAVEDFEALDPGVWKQALKQFEKLKRSPQLGKELGHKMGVNLTGYRALRFYKGRYRIVYRILEEEREVEIGEEGGGGHGHRPPRAPRLPSPLSGRLGASRKHGKAPHGQDQKQNGSVL